MEVVRYLDDEELGKARKTGGGKERRPAAEVVDSVLTSVFSSARASTSVWDTCPPNRWFVSWSSGNELSVSAFGALVRLGVVQHREVGEAHSCSCSGSEDGKEVEDDAPDGDGDRIGLDLPLAIPLLRTLDMTLGLGLGLDVEVDGGPESEIGELGTSSERSSDRRARVLGVSPSGRREVGGGSRMSEGSGLAGEWREECGLE